MDQTLKKDGLRQWSKTEALTLGCSMESPGELKKPECLGPAPEHLGVGTQGISFLTTPQVGPMYR